MAFCFYNISSIVNGLVYFDQVSLLPTSHLLLITLGMAILLCGVWAVSLQAVNVGTWSGEDDIDVPLLEADATDEVRVPDIAESDVAPALPEIPERDRARSNTVVSESAMSPPSSPTMRRRSYYYAGQSALGVATVGSPPVPVPTPGFSIGLSPASPGFALVPRERRRCTSGQSTRESWDDLFRRPRLRQIVSESDAVVGGDVEQGNDAGVEREETEDGRVINAARARWRWVRGLVLGE